MFRQLIRTALRQRVAVLTAAVLVSLAGAFGLARLPVDVLPDLDKPTVTVMTEAAGFAPEEVEQQISFPLERALAGLPGVQRVYSSSAIGLSSVAVQFDWDADILRSRQLVTERINLLRDSLPAGIQPQLAPISSIMGEIMLLALHSPDGRLDPMQLREFADWSLRPRLLGLQGVSQVTVIGGQVRQYRVEPDPARMQALGIGIGTLEAALADFGRNTSGGFLVHGGSERMLRHLAQTAALEDLRELAVVRDGGDVLRLEQLARVDYGARVPRGDAGFAGHAAVILSVQKQPGADTLALTRAVEDLLDARRVNPETPVAIDVIFRQADFIERSIDNLGAALWHAALIVVLVLFVFLLDTRATLISLAAIPLSVLSTVLVFHWLGLSINTMTLGGLAIAVGELVDDAVVGVENVLQRLRQNALQQSPRPRARVILDATLEVRSAIYHATLIIVVVFVPLFALPGMEGRLFGALGVAYILSILASLLVSISLTPVLCWYLLGGGAPKRTGDSPLLRVFKRWDMRLLDRTLLRPVPVFAAVALFTAVALAIIPQLPVTFLPPFNEGTLTVNVIARPGTSLETSNRIGRLAELALLDMADVAQVGRRTGRAELDEHAEGVHYSELDVTLAESGRLPAAVAAEIRRRLAPLPAHINVGQPISHRLDHLLATVRADLAVKFFGPDIETLQALAADAEQRLAGVDGLVDLQREQEAGVAQLHVRAAAEPLSRYGLRPAVLTHSLETLARGRVVSQVLDGDRRFDLVLRLAEDQRDPAALAALPLLTPAGTLPLGELAQIHEAYGPSRISHENGQRRALLYANAGGADLDAVLGRVRGALDGMALPPGYTVALEGRFQAQEAARMRILWLASLSLALILIILYNRYRSLALSGIVLVNVPLACTGGLIALWLSGNAISLASLVGFVTLAGISTRNGILKISHYINLAMHEGERFGPALIVRGSLERLAPVLMTALVAALALTPLLADAGAPGKEILHPVAVVIFGGLISATLLDTLLTPVLFLRWGERPLLRLIRNREHGEIF